VQFIGGNDEPHRVWRRVKPANEGFLALGPRWLWSFQGIGATFDYLRDAPAEAFVDLAQAFCASLIFGGIVQDGGDGLVFGGPMFQGDGGNREQVRDVGRIGAFPELLAMDAGCHRQGIVEVG
jgi:hypothetical protein